MFSDLYSLSLHIRLFFYLRQLFFGENDFNVCMKESFPQLKVKEMRRVEWSKIRRLMGKPRRWVHGSVNRCTHLQAKQNTSDKHSPVSDSNKFVSFKMRSYVQLYHTILQALGTLGNQTLKVSTTGESGKLDIESGHYWGVWETRH